MIESDICRSLVDQQQRESSIVNTGTVDWSAVIAENEAREAAGHIRVEAQVRLRNHAEVRLHKSCS